MKKYDKCNFPIGIRIFFFTFTLLGFYITIFFYIHFVRSPLSFVSPVSTILWINYSFFFIEPSACFRNRVRSFVLFFRVRFRKMTPIRNKRNKKHKKELSNYVREYRWTNRVLINFVLFNFLFPVHLSRPWKAWVINLWKCHSVNTRRGYSNKKRSQTIRLRYGWNFIDLKNSQWY